MISGLKIGRSSKERRSENDSVADGADVGPGRLGVSELRDLDAGLVACCANDQSGALVLSL